MAGRDEKNLAELKSPNDLRQNRRANEHHEQYGSKFDAHGVFSFLELKVLPSRRWMGHT